MVEIPVELALSLATFACSVENETGSRRLWDLGCYGRANIDDARIMKKLRRLRAASTTNISEVTAHPTITDSAATSHNAPADFVRTLSLIESIYLLSINAATVALNSTTTSASNQIKILMSLGAKIHGVHTFASKLAVYRALRVRGWIVRDGIKFAADFVVYRPGGPTLVHADYAVQVSWIDATTAIRSDTISWKKIQATTRFTEQAKKKVVYAITECLSSSLQDVKTGLTHEVNCNNSNEYDEVGVGCIHFVKISRWIP
ncbi:hypothetical protein HK100_011819 [Physocladia obscura]|uniref:tRNA-intron lyase n=1 Tax=Physocladia obscura TaxID=109957 RepID=A0AAD5XGD1_9FUNG|nr:hypothetical protein HK100_011819 [Physocladia obscura]